MIGSSTWFLTYNIFNKAITYPKMKLWLEESDEAPTTKYLFGAGVTDPVTQDLKNYIEKKAASAQAASVSLFIIGLNAV